MEMQKTIDASGDTPRVLVKWPKVVLFGDSLCQGSFNPEGGLWGDLLADKLQRVGDILNRGFSGYNSKFCRVILPEIVSTSNVSDITAFVIFVGTNDSCAKENVPKICQFVSVEDYQENLEAMIDYLQKIGLTKDKIILLAPPPYSDEKWTAVCKTTGRDLPAGERQTSQYVSALVDLAKKLEIDYVNLYEEMLKEKNWSEYLSDGVHLNPQGGKLLFDLLWPIVEKKVGEKTLFPYWRDFDASYNLK